MKNRRDFLRNTFGLGAGLAAVPRLFAAPTQASGESMDMEHMSHATQRNSGIVSVETPDGRRFDAIVYGERESGKWIAGSDNFHRTHDIPNLFLVDGSSFVTSGRGQPTMTIQALAFRAADRITQLAKAKQI